MADGLAARLVRGSTGADGSAVAALVGEDATYVISGGLGALGLETARWLVARGARASWCCSVGKVAAPRSRARPWRRSRRPGRRSRCARATSLADQVAELGKRCGRRGGWFGGVVHAAGVLDGRMVLSQSWERFRAVMAPKVQGALNLERLTEGAPLDFFVMFSSAAAVLGGLGQADYAAANAGLDALAASRRARGQVALSVAWGPWAGGGMAARLDTREQDRIASQGMRLIEPDEGIATLERLLGARVTNTGRTCSCWRWTGPSSATWPGRCCVTCCRRGKRVCRREPGTMTALAERLRKARSSARPEMLRSALQEMAARVLGLSSGQVAIDARSKSWASIR